MNTSEIFTYIVNRLSLKQDVSDINVFYKDFIIDENTLLTIRLSNKRCDMNIIAEKEKNRKQMTDKIYRKRLFYNFVFEDDKDTKGCPFIFNNELIIVYESVYKSNTFNIEKLMKFCNALEELSKSGGYVYQILGQYGILPKNLNSKSFSFGSSKIYFRLRDWIDTASRQDLIDTFNYFFDKIQFKDETSCTSKLYDITDKNNYKFVSDKNFVSKGVPFKNGFIDYSQIPECYRQFRIDYKNNTWQICGIYGQIMRCIHSILFYLYQNPEDNYMNLQEIIFDEKINKNDV